MKKILYALMMFTTMETIDMADMTLTTDNAETGTQQRIYVVMSNGNSLFDEFEDALTK